MGKCQLAFPVELALVDHGVCAQGLHGIDAASLQLLGADLNHVDRVVVPLRTTALCSSLIKSNRKEEGGAGTVGE